MQAGGEAECAQCAVDLIRQDRGKLLIKGMLQTGTLLRAVVQPDTGIRASELLSHVAILDVPAYHKLMFVSDGGMVIAPDRNQKREILRNVLSLCRFLGYEQPKAAILCAVVVPEMQIKLKQGFGRAIRTETDTCVVAILDERAVHGRRYFRDIVTALPEMPVTNSIQEVERFIRAVKPDSYFQEGVA